MSYSDPSCTKKILEDYLIFATNTDFAKKYPLVSTYYQMSSNIELICKIIRDGFTLKLISDQLKPNYLEILFAFEKGMNNLTKYVTADINSTFKYITFNIFNNICFYVVEVYTELNQLSEASIYWSIKEAIDQKKLSAMKSELKKGSHISFIEFGDISDFNKFKKNERKTSTTLLGLYYIKLGNIKLAISCYERVNHILDWLYNNGQSNYISMNYMSLGSNIAKYYETAGDFNQAIHYYKRTKSYCDRMLASKRIKAFSCSGYTGELPTGKINKVEIEDAKLWQKNTNEKINTLYSNHSKNLTESEINEHNFCKAFCIKNHYYICFNSHDEAFQFLLIANRHAPNTNFQLYTNNNKTLEVVDFHTLTTIKLHKIFQSYLNRPTIDMPSVTDEEWLIYCEKSTQPTDKDKFSLSFSQKSKKNEASPDLAMSSSKKNEAEEFSLNDVLKASIARKLNCDSNSLVALTDDRIGVHFIKVDKEKINQNDLSKKITDSIYKLISNVDVIESGDFDYDVIVNSSDEIEDLSKSFSRLIKKIKKDRLNIEKRVKQRTEQLEKINKAMVGRELEMIKMKKLIEEQKQKK